MITFNIRIHFAWQIPFSLFSLPLLSLHLLSLHLPEKSPGHSITSKELLETMILDVTVDYVSCI